MQTRKIFPVLVAECNRCSRYTSAVFLQKWPPFPFVSSGLDCGNDGPVDVIQNRDDLSAQSVFPFLSYTLVLSVVHSAVSVVGDLSLSDVVDVAYSNGISLIYSF